MSYIGFDKLKAKLARKPGVTNPGALSAFIGRKKYGKKKFQKAAAKGKSMRGALGLSDNDGDEGLPGSR
jgi:hypothetical protein